MNRRHFFKGLFAGIIGLSEAEPAKNEVGGWAVDDLGTEVEVWYEYVVPKKMRKQPV